MNVKQIELK